MRRTSALLRALALAAASALASCAAQDARSPAAVLDAGKVASVVVGRSSRADVFGTLGQPSRTERSGRGEAWIYEAGGGGGRGRDRAGAVATAGAGVIGAFVPYVGLVGSGLGLAGAIGDGRRSGPPEATLAVVFGEEGVVRDCVFSSTAAPAGLPGSPPVATAPIDCRRPALGGQPATGPTATGPPAAAPNTAVPRAAAIGP